MIYSMKHIIQIVVEKINKHIIETCKTDCTDPLTGELISPYKILHFTTNGPVNIWFGVRTASTPGMFFANILDIVGKSLTAQEHDELVTALSNMVIKQCSNDYRVFYFPEVKLVLEAEV